MGLSVWCARGAPLMAEWGRARGRADTWPSGPTAPRRPGLTWPGFLAGFGREIAEQLQTWARAEVAPGRLVPWLPVAFGLGVAVYFSAEREPAAWAAVLAAALFGACAVATRRRPFAFPLALALAAIAAGFTTVP